MINNAGVCRTSPTILEAPWTNLDRILDVNYEGVLCSVRTVAKQMIQRRYGKIANLASTAALGTSLLGTAGYAPTEAAVMALTKRLALELGSFNIPVNAIAPGYIRTDRALPESASPEPRNTADAAVFLASDESSFVTVQILTVDGGRIDFLSHSS